MFPPPPRITVVLPTYNGARFLAQSIESVLYQTYDNIELIIVNDCSTDSTQEIIQSYVQQDSRIKCIHNQTNQKLPKSLNIGFSQATGNYFTWTSDDNYYKPQALEKMLNFLETHKDYVMACADYIIVRSNNRESKRSVATKPHELIASDGIGACFLYRAEIAKKVGLYNESRFLVEDYEYWLRIGLQGKIAAIHEPLYYYRHHDKSLTSQRGGEILSKKIALQLEFADSYLETYKELQSAPIYKELQAIRIINDLVDKPLTEIMQPLATINLDSKTLYRIFKDFYKATFHSVFLEAIKTLGFRYRIKAYYLQKRVRA